MRWRGPIGIALVAASLCWGCMRKPDGDSSNTTSGTDTGQHYADSAWPTLHRDARNSDYRPITLGTRYRTAWQALDGIALWLGPTIDADGNLWVSSGQGHGTPNLRKLSPGGRILWSSPPQRSLDDLDHGAVINAPILDDAGNVYQADTNQLWSFTLAGQLRWVSDLRQHGAEGHFVTPFFTHAGEVAGITTDGRLLAFDRTTGELAQPPLDLPGVAGPAPLDPPPGLNGGGMLAPEFRQPMWNIIMGRNVEVANTPAIHPETGRIYITATGATPESGVLYGIDATANGFHISFTASMGGASGSSPAISADGRRVYAAGGDNTMVALDAATGHPVWVATGVQGAASPSIGPTGLVYSFSGSHIVALDGETGTVRWRQSYDPLADRTLPAIEGITRRGRIDSILTLTDGESSPLLWASINLGYELPGMPFSIPKRVVISAIDALTGSVLATTPIRDSCSALIVPGSDGRLFISLAGVTTSSIYYGLNERLPPIARIDEAPVAGLVALEPMP